jgi:FkbM family methyltransferase
LISADEPQMEQQTSPETSPGANPDYFVSYSLNFEDVILHRIFGRMTNGFYVDVGAQHPTIDNDTKLLYDAGWSGVNIEPNLDFFALLQTGRKRDHNLCEALSDREGEISYYEVASSGLSTCDPQQAEQARSKGHKVVSRQIPVTTLAKVLGQIQPKSFQLLKVDVEGFEEQVLAGNDWTKYRPSIIVVEATYPESPTRRPTSVRANLESKGYAFRYFDGLNDFFADKEFKVSDEVFDRPPNVFDRFRLRALAELQMDRARRLEDMITLRGEMDRLRLENDRLHRELVAHGFEARWVR